MKKQFVNKKGDTWEWEETSEAKKAIQRLHEDITNRIHDLEKDSSD